MSSVYSPTSTRPIDRSSACDDLGVAIVQVDLLEGAPDRVAGRVRADDPVGQRSGPRPVPSASRSSRICRPRSRPGTPSDGVWQPGDRIGHRHGRVPQHGAGAVAQDQVRRRSEPVLVERVAADGQRVVDPDRLARDLAAVLVDGEVGREVGRLAGVEAGRLEVEVPDEQEAGRPDRLDGQGARPRRRRGPAPSPSREVTAAATRNRMSPRWVSSVAILVYWWRSP